MRSGRFICLCVAWAGWVLSCANAEKHDPNNYGQFAPPDAFENGSKLAYYGSENEWGPRQFTAEEAEQYYKRLGQRHILLIMQGHADQAAVSCRAHIAKDPHDLESLFTLAVAQCQHGDIDGSLATAKQAVAAGLPFERFLAGPRDLLAPLTSSPGFQDYFAQHPVRLIHGPMLGAMTDNSVRIWVRTADERTVTVRVFEKKIAGIPVATASADTSKARDYTTVVPIDALKPDTAYFYEIAIGDEPVKDSPRYAFQTFPVADAAATFRIAHGGCAGYAPENERMWDTIASFHPLAMLLLGDNVYIDLPQEAGPLHHYTHVPASIAPRIPSARPSTPIFAIWDDHDVAVDDIWFGPYRDKPSWKPSMLKLFKENWNNPAYGDREWPGCWFKFSIGDVDFFMLDCRYYRTNPFAERAHDARSGAEDVAARRIEKVQRHVQDHRVERRLGLRREARQPRYMGRFSRRARGNLFLHRKNMASTASCSSRPTAIAATPGRFPGRTATRCTT